MDCFQNFRAKSFKNVKIFLTSSTRKCYNYKGASKNNAIFVKGNAFFNKAC